MSPLSPPRPFPDITLSYLRPHCIQHKCEVTWDWIKLFWPCCCSTRFLSHSPSLKFSRFLADIAELFFKKKKKNLLGGIHIGILVWNRAQFAWKIGHVKAVMWTWERTRHQTWDCLFGCTGTKLNVNWLRNMHECESNSGSNFFSK